MKTTINVMKQIKSLSVLSPLARRCAAVLLAAGLAFGGAATASAATVVVSSSVNWTTLTVGLGDTVVVRNGATLTVNSTTAVCGNLQLGGDTVNSGGAGTLAFSASGNPALTVSSSVVVGGSGNNNRNGAITFQSGSTLAAGSLQLGSSGSSPAAGTIAMTSGGTLKVGGAITVGTASGTWTRGTGTVILTANNTLPATIFTTFNNLTINDGTTTGTTILGVNVTVSGNLTVSSGTLDLSTFTANRSGSGGTFTLANGATLLVGGSANFPTTYSTFTLGATSTVNYDYAGNQTVSARAYAGNVIFSGSGVKTIATGTSVTGNLSIAPSGAATALVGNGLTINVGSLTLGGLGRINGTWGSTSGSCPATYKNITYFGTTATGVLSVTTDLRTAATVTTSPTGATITYGQTLGSSALSGGVGSPSGGTFTWTTSSTVPVFGAPAQSVTYTPAAADTPTYKPGSGTASLTVTKLGITGSFTANSKPYDGNNSETVLTRTLSGVLAGDTLNVTLTGGTATFADALPGIGKTVTLAGATLGGPAAGNYNLLSVGTTTANITAVVANDVTRVRAPGLTLKIKIADIAWAVNPDGSGHNAVTVTSLGSGGQSATLSYNSTYIFYTPAAGNNNNDSFNYTVTDGSGTATGTTTVNVVNPGGLVQEIKVDGSSVVVNFVGIPGYHYDIQKSSSLSGVWITVDTQTAPDNGLFSYTETVGGSAYFRLIQQQD
ncbi:MAG: YDG domain-containing protein [Verrucomicrobiota bacterium]